MKEYVEASEFQEQEAADKEVDYEVELTKNQNQMMNLWNEVIQ